MNLTKLSKSLSSITRLVSRSELRISSSSYSTTLLADTRSPKNRRNNSLNQLYRRISPIGDPTVSIVPILDQWIAEGNSVHKDQLHSFVKELRYYKRYTHALEISMWMSDKRYIKLTPRDVAVRLDLMSKVSGVEQVEKYFDNIPQQLKVLEVYGALLNCYAHAKCVEKAEAVMQKMKDLGFLRSSLAYNVMLNLYHGTENTRKFDALLHEMEENGVVPDRFTIGIQLSAYSAISDISGMEKTIRRAESDTKVALDWSTYAIVANGYTKAGLSDKALEMLKKSEGLIDGKKRSIAYNFLLTQYAAIGRKEEVLRLWKLYKTKEKVYNKGYICIITSLLKLDDFENAEKIFDEWESENQKFDMHIPNYLIAAYSRKGHMEQAETFVDRAMSNGEKPNAYTWYCLATGYLRNNQSLKAVEMMKKAITEPGPKLKISSESLASCLEYLKEQGELEKAEEFIQLLLDNGIICLDVQERLLNNIRAGKSRTDTLDVLGDSSVILSKNELEVSEPEGNDGDFVS